MATSAIDNVRTDDIWSASPNQDRSMDQTGLPGSRTEPKRMTLLRRFVRGRRGVAAIEFAMVAVPFIGLLAAIFETAFVFFVHEAFDNTVNNVARQV
ncbi:MAG TPA: TadE family protein, partial [Rhodoblastus sp.]|nr:TadE family protein [Rhodoblastus sp.]